MTVPSLKILFTGDYLPQYNRTAIIRAGLKSLGHEVLEFPFQKKNRVNRRQLESLAAQVDFIFMPSFTHREVPWVRKCLPHKPLIFDPLISRYLTKVYDYKLVSPWGLPALRNYFRDKRALDAADFVVSDTLAHLEYFHTQFKTPKIKMGPLYIGNDFSQFYPSPELRPQAPSAEPAQQNRQKTFRVGFYGGFIPLQGVMKVLEAALLLRDDQGIKFELIGNGFEFEMAQDYITKHNLTNVTLPGWLTEEKLREHICRFDLALGVFGETKKADLVIPNKLYHYVACARPVLTKKTDAVLEIFKENEHLRLTSGDPQAIADAILQIRNQPDKAEAMAQRAYTELKEKWDATHVATKLLDYFKDSQSGLAYAKKAQSLHDHQ
jgi:glycosyltransferase involved in cell wall biosynthesis